MIRKYLFYTLLALLPMSGFAEGGFTLRGFGGYNSVSFDDKLSTWNTETTQARKVKIKDGAVIGAALGYRFTDFARGEIETSYRRNEIHQDLETKLFVIRDKGDLETFSLMANGIFTWPHTFLLQPYVGIGLGLTGEFANWHTCIIEDRVLYDLLETNRVGISYQAIAGVHLPPYNDLYCGIEFRVLDSVIDHMCCCNRSIIFTCRKEF